MDAQWIQLKKKVEHSLHFTCAGAPLNNIAAANARVRFPIGAPIEIGLDLSSNLRTRRRNNSADDTRALMKYADRVELFQWTDERLLTRIAELAKTHDHLAATDQVIVVLDFGELTLRYLGTVHARSGRRMLWLAPFVQVPTAASRAE